MAGCTTLGSTLRESVLGGYDRQLVGHDIPAILRFHIGPDDSARWPDEMLALPGNFKRLNLPPVRGVQRGVSGSTIAFSSAPIPPDTIEADIFDYDQNVLDSFAEWSELGTRVRLWITAYMWITAYIVDSIQIPRKGSYRLLLHPVQIGRYNEVAPDDVLVDPWYDTELATTITVGAAQTFLVNNAAGFAVDDAIRAWANATSMYFTSTITNIAVNTITVADDLGAGFAAGDAFELNNIILRGEAE